MTHAIRLTQAMRRTAIMCALLGPVSCGGKVNEAVPDEDPETEETETETAVDTDTETETETTDEPPPAECVPSARLLQHVCTHTNNGPYTSVAATGDPDDLPDVSRLHGAFDVSVIAQPARFQYDASRTGTHIVFTNAEIEWSTIDANGNGHPMAPVTGGSCPGTTSGGTFDVDKGQTITLEAAAPPAQFTLFVEHVATFGNDALICTSSE